ncbi:DUF5961 family protein [Phenylobacterium sp.]|uniref:DUF5961 family protein n=1 Tax=Phenylobacterium sp. TaxID=1871053 RepID=UPI0030F45DDC
MTDRHFSARAATQGQQRAFDVSGPDFETAAFAFVDLWHPQTDDEVDVEVVVTDTETGERHCFRIDLGSGEVEACG